MTKVTATPDRDVAETFDTGGWAFTSDVVAVFPEHVRASVPFYEPIQALVAEVADWTLPDGGVFADLGASTGTTLEAIAARHASRTFTAHLYDESAPMLDRARENVEPLLPGRVGYHEQKIETPLAHAGADLTVSLFTLQFLPLPLRVAALREARAAAAETGVLLVAEKVRPIDSRWAEIANDRSHDWKARHGISDEAIRAKAAALRGVLIPHPTRTLTAAMTAAGWGTPEVLFAWHSWVVLGAFAADAVDPARVVPTPRTSTRLDGR